MKALGSTWPSPVSSLSLFLCLPLMWDVYIRLKARREGEESAICVLLMRDGLESEESDTLWSGSFLSLLSCPPDWEHLSFLSPLEDYFQTTAWVIQDVNTSSQHRERANVSHSNRTPCTARGIQHSSAHKQAPFTELKGNNISKICIHILFSS